MNIEEFTAYCLNKKGVEESFPFGGDTLVFKVMGKIFALTGIGKYTLYRKSQMYTGLGHYIARRI
jgi:predicted DNA-binding protein (MmcQ/YjbR family)